MKTALITGITGQDAAYLSKFLLDKGYKVIGCERRTATSGELWRLKHLGIEQDIEIVPLELAESSNIRNILKKYKPDEIYHLAAMSFVAGSFEQPEYVGNVNGLGTLRILEAMKEIVPNSRMFNASTSEMFGKVIETPQNENTPFYPRSPYGVSKLYAHWMVTNYREAYNLFCCSAISFNHESELRGSEFVTKKIVSSLKKIIDGKLDVLEIGNLDAKRDWGFAGDYVEAYWKMLQHDSPDDFVICTGETHSVREFLERTCYEFDLGEIKWVGDGVNEEGFISKSNQKIIKINPKFYRPSEVDLLCGDGTKAKIVLQWEPKVSFEQLVSRMVDYELLKE